MLCGVTRRLLHSLVALVSPEGAKSLQVVFEGEEEKISAYAGVVQRAKSSGTTILITINAARTIRASSEDDMEGYWWGKLAAEGARDCISITASGPGMQSIGLDLAYEIVDGKVIFDAAPDFVMTEIGMLVGWPDETAARLN
jgi:hypothetical protein